MNHLLRLFPGIIVLMPLLCQSAEIKYDLLPQPQELQLRDGVFEWDARRVAFTIAAESKDSGERLSRHLLELLDEIGAAHKGRPSVRVTAAKPGEGCKLVATRGWSRASDRKLTVEPTAETRMSPSAESYQLQVNSRAVVIAAESERGLFYGLQTFGQLLNSAKVRGDKGIPCLRITDWPALPMRGYSEDYGRNQLPTISDHKRMIRFLARHKMSTYLWFIESDHFVYEFDPNIGVKVDRFRFDEIRELVAYARDYYVEVIPTVELLGHMEGLLSHTNYSRFAEVPGKMDLCATSDEAFEVVRRIVSEVAPAFESKYFHCGLDESFQIGKGQSAQAVKEKGLERVMADYYIRMNDLVKSRGKTMMMYADIVLAHPRIMDLLPKDIVLMFWDYMPSERYANLDKLRQAGYTTTSLSGLWDWAHLYPPYSYSFRNIEALARQSMEVGALGHFVSSWGDPFYSPAGLNLSEWNTYGVAYTAALSWKPISIEIPDFSRAFATFHYGQPGLAGMLKDLAEFQGNPPFRGDLHYVRKFFEETPANVSKHFAKADAEEMQYWQTIKETLARAKDRLASARVSRNQDHIESLLLSVKLNLFAAKKVIAFQAMASELGNQSFDKERHAVAIGQLAAELDALGKDYQRIYLATNRPINMRYLGARWAEMVGQLTECAAAIRNGEWGK